MRPFFVLLALVFCIQASSSLTAQQSDSSKVGATSPSSADSDSVSKDELSETDQQIIRLRLDAMLEKDQQFRTYLALNTTDEKKVAEYEKLSETEQMKTMFQKKKDKLPEEVEKVLWEFQRRNDR